MVNEALSISDPHARVTALVTVVERDIVQRLDRRDAPDVAKTRTLEALIDTFVSYRQRGADATILMEHCVSRDFWDAYLTSIVVEAWSRAGARARLPTAEAARLEAKRRRKKIIANTRAHLAEKRLVREQTSPTTNDPLIAQIHTAIDSEVARSLADAMVPLPPAKSWPKARWMDGVPSGSAEEIRVRLRRHLQGPK
jgi:hypothetical protein